MQATQEVYYEVAELGLTLKTPLAHGIQEAPAQDQHIYRLEVTMWFPQVQLVHANAADAHELPAILLAPVRIGMFGCMLSKSRLHVWLPAYMHLCSRPLILPDQAHLVCVPLYKLEIGQKLPSVQTRSPRALSAQYLFMAGSFVLAWAQLLTVHNYQNRLLCRPS